ncbi:DUF4892 domain-containing protein [Pseudomonas guariconensis]|uniref:DUF4892 domain-containing protein n=1 Tax=Pseudomonas TaxID=286 RepID=UPI001CE43DFA|nr:MULTISPECIES: DUF4892 domain-containing protein [Pseudomonas]MCO7637039.1 DUF4892 domain-containing protein [Pseudomonas sp. S 311-6]MCO7517458.1 DUF4892 domain-containing protein [Pseudomonas putida]MCO7567190.1 DUF4892 domain-containing protein [Pseudomonas mosselii]MCO7594777.1 DUF4892 domain-containing protein [Pseudomonas guariconensis]MCO7607942.1 DUF4892 domain-containing protein [Pseudomonas guariconensis]
MSARAPIRTFIVGCLGFASPLLWAASLPVPVDAKVVDQRPAVEQERVYPMGGLRRISGRLRVEEKVESRGLVSSVTYELPVERTAREAFTSAREALQREGGYPLFWCQGRDCGEASLWANQVFGNARLNGGDEQQAFILLRRSAEEADTLVALYSVTRGNRRAYLHVEEFVASSPLGELLPTPATVLRELRDTGKLDYPDLASPQPAWVALLGRSLNLDSTLRASLSGSEAEAWREELVKAGVRSARLEVGEATTTGLHLELIR